MLRLSFIPEPLALSCHVQLSHKSWPLHFMRPICSMGFCEMSNLQLRLCVGKWPTSAVQHFLLQWTISNRSSMDIQIVSVPQLWSKSIQVLQPPAGLMSQAVHFLQSQIAWWSERLQQLICLPAHPSMRQHARHVALMASDFEVESLKPKPLGSALLWTMRAVGGSSKDGDWTICHF